MSHQITERANGFAEFAYVGEQGWHKLGQRIKEPSTMRTCSAFEQLLAMR
jgi:hypothetical protein